MIDTLLKQKALPDESKILSGLGLLPSAYGVLTLHRPSNVDDKETFQRILSALHEVSKGIAIVFPCHPRTKKKIDTLGLGSYFMPHSSSCSKGIHMIESLGYLEFIQLMREARFVLTDSGGIQEETTILGIPCMTLRENTERPVTVTEGTNMVVGTDRKKIVEKTQEILNGHSLKGRVPKFWDGKASERIVKVLIEHCCSRRSFIHLSKLL